MGKPISTLLALALALFAVPVFAAGGAELAAAARAASDRGDYEKAEELYAKAIAAEPKNAQYHYLLGGVLGTEAQKASMFSMAGLAKKANEEFLKAVELDPNFIDARFALIDYYTMAPGFLGGSEEEAQKQVVEIRKRDALNGHRAQARVYARQKKMDLARKEFVDAVREQPNSAKAHAYYGAFLITDKDWVTSQHELEMALKLDATYMPAYYRLGQLAARSESNYAKGDEALHKYLAYKPADNEPQLAGAWYWLGQIQEKQGKKADAKKSYTNGLKLAPEMKELKEGLKGVS
jgi:Tfp pilus assembly protein PilF